METWPSSFPLPNANLAGDNAETTLRTQMDSGRTRQRQRFTKDVFMVNVTWSLTDVQLAVFVGFHRSRLHLGNDWFLIDLPLGDGVKLHTARFVNGKYKQSYAPTMHWEVSAQLELETRLYLEEPVLDAYLEVGFSDVELENFLDAIDDAYEVTHVTLPTLLI